VEEPEKLDRLEKLDGLDVLDCRRRGNTGRTGRGRAIAARIQPTQASRVSGGPVQNPVGDKKNRRPEGVARFLLIDNQVLIT
jgi:hypothetical protein